MNDDAVLEDIELLRPLRTRILEICALHGASNVRIVADPPMLIFDLEPGRSLLDIGEIYGDLRDLVGCRVPIATANGLRQGRRRHLLDSATVL